MPKTAPPGPAPHRRDELLTWEEAFAAGSAVAGGKGWNLARLVRYGFKVPPGGVVPASVYAGLFRTPDVAALAAPLATATLDEIGSDDLEARLAALRELVIRTGLPPAARAAVGRFLEETGLDDRPLAVRSSAAAEDGADTAFAGIHESYLGVVGLDAVCAATGMRPRTWSGPGTAGRSGCSSPGRSPGCRAGPFPAFRPRRRSGRTPTSATRSPDR